VVSITNLPITLKQLAMNYGLRPSSKDTTMVTLIRDDQKFRMTAGQMFDKSFPRILIQDGDQIEIDEVAEGPSSSEAVVGSRGNILLPGIGSIKADNRSLTEVQAGITRILIKKGLVPNFQLEISDFRSKEFFLVTANGRGKTIALDSSELDLKTAVLSNTLVDESVNITHSDNKLTMVKLFRNGLLYRMTLQEMLSGGGSNVFIEDGDTIELKDFNYKSGQVFALSGAGKAKIVPIDPSKRETLADILFTENGALSNILARRSEIYLLRGRSPSIAYHLDAQNVSRILVAAKTELRPNDIVFVADRPIISFARTLGELSPLQILIRDIRRDTLLN
jgi:polysaccharide export outer membrane protein